MTAPAMGAVEASPVDTNVPDLIAHQLAPTQLARYSELIDVRSPAEFAEDHIPGAINLPVLDNAERARVGTLHKQESAFAAKKVGAALVSRHIADYLESHFASQPPAYKPLVYCWRGGSRSGSMTHVLQRVGFKAEQLDGGYKAYRRRVVNELESLPAQFRFRVICGPTGSGKSRLLQALSAQGGQVLDLEELAEHRGSLLGGLPGQPQPSQKMLETRLWWALRQFDPAQPVFVESESKKVGGLHLPDALMAAIRAGTSHWIEAALDLRVKLLLRDYTHFVEAPESLLDRLQHLVALRGQATVDRWVEQVRRGAWAEFVQDMLESHYDPAYFKSLARNYAVSPESVPESERGLRQHALSGLEDADFSRLAQELLRTA